MGSVIKSIGGALGFQNSSEGMQGAFTDAQRRAADALKAQQANESAFANQLAQGALGQGPSVVDMQLKAAQDRTLAQQLAAARSQRSVNPALAMRNIQQAAGQQNAELAQAGATGRIQEQRGQQSDYANYLNSLKSAEANTLNAAANNAQASDKAENAFGSSLLNAGAAVGAGIVKSDEMSKKNIKDGGKNAKSFLDALSAKSYKYKDENSAGAGSGEFLGVMAQDLEKAGPVGKSLVKDTPQGKMVDYGKGFGALLATQADVNKRLAELESKKKKA